MDKLTKEQQVYNLQIVYELLDFLLEHPEVRFFQALWCLGLGITNSTDRFYEPSKKTFEKMHLRKVIEEVKPKGK